MTFWCRTRPCFAWPSPIVIFIIIWLLPLLIFDRVEHRHLPDQWDLRMSWVLRWWVNKTFITHSLMMHFYLAVLHRKFLSHWDTIKMLLRSLISPLLSIFPFSHYLITSPLPFFPPRSFPLLFSFLLLFPLLSFPPPLHNSNNCRVAPQLLGCPRPASLAYWEVRQIAK